uniref:Uncharacterized protein n=1 Tax=Parascaris equorum TaxID=6256 RepID=A0A914RQD6_PAREQ
MSQMKSSPLILKPRPQKVCLFYCEQLTELVNCVYLVSFMNHSKANSSYSPMH